MIHPSTRRKFGLYALVSLLVLFVLSNIHFGTIYIEYREPYNERNAVKRLSRQLLLHPFADSIQLEWPVSVRGNWDVTYQRSTRKLSVDLEGYLWNPYSYIAISDFEIHKWATRGASLDDVKKWHTRQYLYPQ